MERARNNEFDLAVPDIVFARLDERSRPTYLERASFAARIREPSAALGKAVLGWMMLGGYPIPSIHGQEKMGSASWPRTEDDALVLAAHASHGRDVLVTTDKKLRTRAAAKGIRTMTPEGLLAALDNERAGSASGEGDQANPSKGNQ